MQRARTKLIVRGLPYDTTEDSIGAFLKTHRLSSDIAVLNFHHGKPPNKLKGRGAVCAWVIIHVTNVSAKEALVSLVHQKPWNPEIHPTTLASVEFTPLQRTSFRPLHSTERDSHVGSIYNDADFRNFLEQDSSAAAVPAPSAAPHQQRTSTEAGDPPPTKLVHQLVRHWYYGAKFSWEADDAAHRETKFKKDRGRRLTREQEIMKQQLRDQKRRERKEKPRRKEATDTKEAKRQRRAERKARNERNERKAAVLQAATATPIASSTPQSPEKKNVFTVTSARGGVETPKKQQQPATYHEALAPAVRSHADPTQPDTTAKPPVKMILRRLYN